MAVDDTGVPPPPFPLELTLGTVTDCSAANEPPVQAAVGLGWPVPASTQCPS